MTGGNFWIQIVFKSHLQARKLAHSRNLSNWRVEVGQSQVPDWVALWNPLGEKGSKDKIPVPKVIFMNQINKIAKEHLSFH